MTGTPWIRFWRVDDCSLKSRVLGDLCAKGIAVGEAEPGASGREGIILFSAVDEDLLDFIGEVSGNREERVLAVSVSGDLIDNSRIWRLLHAGACDVLQMRSHGQVADCIAARLQRWHAIDELLHSDAVTARLVGTGRRWKALLRQVIEVALFTRAAVLLCGESGTGKELIGRLIHELDPAASMHDLALVDCTTVVPELSGSEFFGHERGAFTGAVAARDGAIAAADGGVLFLDEVGELPAALQAQLLRVIQEGAYKRVGSDVWRHSRFRLVSATHRDLPKAVEDGRFRQDLYHRIAGWVFHVPALRERREDILPLARHFLRNPQHCNSPTDFDPAVAEYLQTHPYPGNVRELRQLVARMCGRHVGPGPITAGDLPEDEWPATETGRQTWRGAKLEDAIGDAVTLGVSLREISQAATDTAARIALRRENGNLQAAAHMLRVTDRALQLRRAAWRNH